MKELFVVSNNIRRFFFDLCKTILLSGIFFLMVNILAAQDTTRYTNSLRGYEFDFSNPDFPNYPVFKFVYPGSSASKMTSLFPALIDEINGQSLDNLTRERIVELMLSQDTAEMTLRHHGCKTKEACKNPPKEWKNKWENPNPQTFTLLRLNGPEIRKHPLGECIYGDCWNGNGYLLLSPDSPDHKKGDSFKGRFKEGQPDSGILVKYGLFNNFVKGVEPKKPPKLDHSNSNVEQAANAAPIKPNIDSVNGAFLKTCVFDPKPHLKTIYGGIYQPNQVYFQRELIYVGNLWGHTPNGFGKLVYNKSAVPSPMPDGYAYKLVTEGNFEYGECKKIEKLYTERFDGYYVTGSIGLTYDWFLDSWNWNCYDCSLYNMNYMNEKGESIRNDVKVYSGEYNAGEPVGKGILYFSNDMNEPLYGAQIEIPNIENGFMKDSVILVMPDKNIRKTILIDKPYWIPLENIGDFVTARFLGDNRSAGLWRREVLTPPVEKNEASNDPYELIFKEVVRQSKLAEKKSYYAQEGIVYPEGKLIEKSVHIELQTGQKSMLTIYTLGNVRSQIEHSDAETPYNYIKCPGFFVQNINKDNNMKINLHYGCYVANTKLNNKTTYTFKIKANSTEPIYYVLTVF